MHLVISGYYGYGNIGDEAILAATVRELRSRYPRAKLTVLSADPPGTATRYDVEAIPRWSFPAIWRVLRTADMLISGGGGLIQDATSALSPLYYLAVVRLARLAGTPYIIFAQGLGPLQRSLTRWATARCLQKAAAITVRDEQSAQLLTDLNVTTPAAEITADPALLLPPCPAGQTAQLLAQAGVGEKSRLIGIALRSWKESDLVTPAADLIRHLRQAEATQVLLIPFQPKEDLTLAWRLASEAGERVSIVNKRLSPAEILGLVSRLDLLVSIRLHGLIFAAAAQVPAIGLSYDPKVEAFGTRAGQPVIPLQQLTSDRLIQQVEHLWDRRVVHIERLKEKGRLLRHAAVRNFDILAELLEPPPPAAGQPS